MALYFQREMDRLKKEVLTVGAMVEENLGRSVRAILKRDPKLAEDVVSYDRDVDDMEVEVEEDCLKILALHQPVAIDLRFIVAVLKINSDLERIGDLAVNLAERFLHMANLEPMPLPYDLGRMADVAQSMLRDALDALVNFDADQARRVLAADDEIDQLHKETYRLVQEAVLTSPAKAEVLINSLAFSRHLERIGDHTTNIAEDVIYMTEGAIIRHRHKSERLD